MEPWEGRALRAPLCATPKLDKKPTYGAPAAATEYLRLLEIQRPEGAIRVLRQGLALLSLP